MEIKIRLHKKEEEASNCFCRCNFIMLFIKVGDLPKTWHIFYHVPM